MLLALAACTRAGGTPSGVPHVLRVAFAGDPGSLVPLVAIDQEIIALTSELARLKRERAEGEQRVSLLRSEKIDPDMLDERARFQLDYVNPHDLVRMNNSN